MDLLEVASARQTNAEVATLVDEVDRMALAVDETVAKLRAGVRSVRWESDLASLEARSAFLRRSVAATQRRIIDALQRTTRIAGYVDTKTIAPHVETERRLGLAQLHRLDECLAQLSHHIDVEIAAHTSQSSSSTPDAAKTIAPRFGPSASPRASDATRRLAASNFSGWLPVTASMPDVVAALRVAFDDAAFEPKAAPSSPNVAAHRSRHFGPITSSSSLFSNPATDVEGTVPMEVLKLRAETAVKPPGALCGPEEVQQRRRAVFDFVDAVLGYSPPKSQHANGASVPSEQSTRHVVDAPTAQQPEEYIRPPSVPVFASQPRDEGQHEAPIPRRDVSVGSASQESPMREATPPRGTPLTARLASTTPTADVTLVDSAARRSPSEEVPWTPPVDALALLQRGALEPLARGGSLAAAPYISGEAVDVSKNDDAAVAPSGASNEVDTPALDVVAARSGDATVAVVDELTSAIVLVSALEDALSSRDQA